MPQPESAMMPGATAHHRDTEAAVLGAMMLERDALSLVLEIIPEPECFYTEAHRVVFEAIRNLSGSGQKVDLLTVTQELVRNGTLTEAGGAGGVTMLASGVLSSAHVESHARIVMEQWVKRATVEACATLQAAALDGETDAFELLNNAEYQFAKINAGIIKTPFRHISEAAADLLKTIRADRALNREVVGVTSGLKSLDDVTTGFQPGNLIIIAARPGVGKTAFGLNIATRAAARMEAEGGAKTAFFSLEMSEEELVQRVLAEAANVPLALVRNPVRLSEQGINSLDYSVAALQNKGLYLDTTAALSIPEFRSKARRLVHKCGVGLILIDYLQLMSGDTKRNGNREQEVAQISRELKKTAKELAIPIIAFSQMSRGVETRSDKKPQLSDLRESGALEQDADMVGFLYRPSKEEIVNTPALMGTGSLSILKNRHGDAGVVLDYNFLGEYQRWAEINATSWTAPNAGIPETRQQLSVPPAPVPEDLPF